MKKAIRFNFGPIAVCCCIVSFLTYQVQAGQLIASFDLGDSQVYSGFGPYDAESAQFTAVNTASGATGTANGITLQTYNASSFFTGLGSTIPTELSALFGDYAVQEGPGSGGDNQGNFRLTGLSIGQAYDIYIIAPNGTGYGVDNVYGGDYTISIGSADSSTVRATGVEAVFSGWVEGRDYAVFRNAMSDGTGEFSGTFNRIDSQAHTGIAGVQIVAVPEPTSISLLGMTFSLGLLIRRQFFS